METWGLFVCMTTFSLCIAIVYSKSTGRNKCHLMSIPLQTDLDLDRFSGKWYGTSKTGIGDSLLSYLTEVYDGKVNFKTNFAGGYDINAAGSKFYGGWCPKAQGVAIINNRGEPQKMTMYFDTTIGRKIGMKPGWVLTTDYTNYAVFYSCWKELLDGTCDPDKTYAFLLQRSPKVLSRDKQQQVDLALSKACVDRSTMSAIKHYGYCYEKEGL